MSALVGKTSLERHDRGDTESKDDESDQHLYE